LRPQPAGCLECHASAADPRQGVGCLDCHEPRTLALRITRTSFLAALDAKDRPAQQEMRSFVCGQCHSEYYFTGPERAVARPWAQGLKAEQVEAWYDKSAVNDWVHAETGASLIRIRHPQFEMWRQGIHARSGVSCADCHMGPLQRGAARISDHHIASPLTRMEQACLRCHRVSQSEMAARVNGVRAIYEDLESRALAAMTGLLDEVYLARERGASEAELEPVQRCQRRAMLRMGFAADGSRGFHASSESARLFAEAIDFARRGQVKATGIRAR
jgi:nitrite reductase (cytochrome c-552)